MPFKCLRVGGKFSKLMYVRDKGRTRTNNTSQANNRIGTSMNLLVKSSLEQTIKESSGFFTMYYLITCVDISLEHTYQLKNYVLVRQVYCNTIFLSGSPNK